MWWSRGGPGRWVAPCRDVANRRREVVVMPTGDGRIALIVPAGEVAVLDLLAAGRLRGALRDAAFALDEPHRHEMTLAGVG